MKWYLLALPCLIPLCGCQNNYYSQKFRSTTTPETARYLLPHAGTAEIVPVLGSEVAGETRKYEQGGYMTIGYSKFKADTDDYTPILRAAAQEVQADLVLSSATPLGDREEILAQDQSAPSIGNTSGSGGYIQASGGRQPAASMGTGGSNSGNNMMGPAVATAVPESQYLAVFLRKHVVLLGANVAAPGAAGEAPARGLAVASVVEGSPAAQAGVLPGDVVVSMDDEAVADVATYRKLVESRAGKTARLTVVRDGAEKTIQVTLNSIPGGP